MWTSHISTHHEKMDALHDKMDLLHASHVAGREEWYENMLKMFPDPKDKAAIDK